MEHPLPVEKTGFCIRCIRTRVGQSLVASLRQKISRRQNGGYNGYKQSGILPHPRGNSRLELAVTNLLYPLAGL